MGEDPPQGGHGPGIDVAVTRAPTLARLPLAAARVQRLARYVLEREAVAHASLHFAFVGRRTIASVHRRITGVPGPTDIVTLQHARQAPGAPVVGEVWIAPEVARENARRFGTSLLEECRRLVVHGALHALGWEHPATAQREDSAMWRRQERLLRDATRRGIG
ncbi:MAG: rRNA maturation RNase YbeY [Gemmatimonadetes bacterium]|nr:rRNA maturation RNase YbeY [Gemmatimonadota bacterium]